MFYILVILLNPLMKALLKASTGKIVDVIITYPHQ